MRKPILSTLVALVAASAFMLVLAGCGGKAAAQKSTSKAWTVSKVEAELDERMDGKLHTDITSHCLPKDGTEGGRATLICDFTMPSGTSAEAEVVVDKTGDWIVNGV